MSAILDAEDEANHAPWWLGALKTWGVAAGIGIFLVWFTTQVVVGKLDDIRAAQTVAQTTLDRHSEAVRMDQSELRYLLRQICLNVSTTEGQRAGCVLPGQAR